MRTLPVLLAAALLLAGPARAERFTAIAFHDVVDDTSKLGSDDVTTGELVAFFDWLKGNGWTPVSFDDIDAARKGTRPLPKRAILLTFDDGDRSAYTRVYPLLLAYRFPAVFSLVGAWVDAPMNGTVIYSDKPVPRARFLSWDEMREMQSSGLAEFASHSYDLHQGVRGNPQGSLTPAAATWTYDARTGRYEDDAAVEARVYADLAHSIALMRRELGRAPRVLAWPYGRDSGPAIAAARKAGFRYLMTLTPEPPELSRPFDISRFFPSQGPDLKDIAPALRFAAADPEQRRILCLGLDGIATKGAGAIEALGNTIEEIRKLGANVVVLDPIAQMKDGHIASAWFPSALVPTKTDFLSFAAWQIRTRAGVRVFLKIDLAAAEATVGRARVADLVREIVRVAPVDGITLDPSGVFANPGTAPTGPEAWNVRAARDALAAPGDLALEAWRAAEGERPGLRLAIRAPGAVVGAWPPPAVDWILMPENSGAAVQQIADRGWFARGISGRVALPLADDEEAPARMRRAQALGAAAFALCPAPVLPTRPELGATFSASRFPKLP